MITVTDQFCGAGGSSIGAVAAGAELRLGLNHWKLAIETHASNFPHADHDCTDISACDPRRYPSTDILITSPECTNHSLAKGRSRQNQQADLFGNLPDPSEERSRATMWDVPRFAEYHRYRLIIVENVVDARLWVTWDAWLHAMRLLGYDHQTVYLNSQFAWPTPQSRDRLYVIFWRHGNKAPDLDVRPLAACEHCGHDVQAVQSWKQPHRRWGRYGDQYVYRCPDCARTVRPYYYAAANAIDWSLPSPRIGDRARPLKAKTIARIQAGLDKYGGQHLLVGNYTPGWTRPITEPAGTVTTSDHHGLIVQLNYAGGDRVRPTTDVMPTQTTRQDTGLVTMPFLTSYYGTGQSTAIDEPVPTVTSLDRHALVTPPFILGYYTRLSGVQAAVSGIDEAMPTQSTQPRHYLVTPPFIARLRNNQDASAISDTLGTVTAGGGHFGLVVPPGDAPPPPSIDDCGFRMLQPHEIKAAMAFPDHYRVLGTKRDQVRQLGNAVTPPVMELLLQRSLATLA